jgi:hypothetical protein
MAKNPDPVVLELASLPREQAGPFLLLGLDKTADKEAVEANWADRVKWSRKGLLKVPLEDVNWARDALGDVQRRVRADAASLNVDLSDGLLGRLAYRYGVAGRAAGRAWQPLDREKPLADYAPPAEVPDPRELAAALAVPEVPEEMPAAATLLEQLAAATLDPWAVELPADETLPRAD